MTKRSLRAVQCIAVAAAGAMSLTACSSSGGGSKPQSKLSANYSYGSIPAPSTSITNGGTVDFADPVGATPNWILPILQDADNSVFNTFTFEYLMYRQLYWYPKGSDPVIDYSKSLTDGPPAISNGGKTFTITLNGKYTWSNGTPVTAQDVLFDFDLMKAGDKVNPADNADYIAGQYPDNVTSAVALNSQTVQFTFNKVYNPTSSPTSSRCPPRSGRRPPRTARSSTSPTRRTRPRSSTSCSSSRRTSRPTRPTRCGRTSTATSRCRRTTPPPAPPT
jgi:peptide/nickel transport system substrate-binding protein